MARGKIRKVVSDRGFGFIEQQGGPNVFFHHSVVENRGFESLTDGQEVEFEFVQGDKGPKATSVAPV